MLPRIGLLILLAPVSVFATEAFEVSGAARVETLKSKHPAEGLTLSTDTPVLWLSEKDGAVSIEVELSGRFARSDWKLLRGTDPVAIDEAGSFGPLRIPVVVGSPTVEFTAVGPYGKVEQARYKIVIVDERVLRPSEWAVWRTPRWSAGSELSVSRISYGQTLVERFEEWALTGKFSTQYAIDPDRWTVGFSVFSNVAVLGSSGPETIQFLGVNLRGYYKFSQLKDPWNLGLGFGDYYTTSFSSSGDFGFQNMGGPQLQPTLRRRLASGDSVGAFFKFAAITDSFAVLSLGSNEVAFGVDYSRPWSGGTRSWGVSLSLSLLNLEFQGIEVESSALSLGANIGF
jgi:hypothetical protein